MAKISSPFRTTSTGSPPEWPRSFPPSSRSDDEIPCARSGPESSCSPLISRSSFRIPILCLCLASTYDELPQSDALRARGGELPKDCLVPPADRRPRVVPGRGGGAVLVRAAGLLLDGQLPLFQTSPASNIVFSRQTLFDSFLGCIFPVEHCF